VARQFEGGPKAVAHVGACLFTDRARQFQGRGVLAFVKLVISKYLQEMFSLGTVLSNGVVLRVYGSGCCGCMGEVGCV
jgi:hypothetical protein